MLNRAERHPAEAVRRMSTARGGRGGAIENVSSAGALLGSPNEYIHYAATKAAIDALTIGLAKEVATQGIRVNAARLGLFYTELHATGGEPGREQRLPTRDSLSFAGFRKATVITRAEVRVAPRRRTARTV